MDENQPTIWVTNDAGHSTEKALLVVPNAVIRPLTLGDINPLRVDRLCYHIARGITQYGKEEDYLLLSGYQMVNAMAVHLWLTHFKTVRILQWNAKQRRYELTEKSQDDFENLLQREMER